jgi:hypothetical protein
MDWKTYTLHMLATNMVMACIIFLILVFQAYLPLNPLGLAGMEPVLAFNTAISFITNTDWQGDDSSVACTRGSHILGQSSVPRVEWQQQLPLTVCRISNPSAIDPDRYARLSRKQIQRLKP